MVGRPYGTWPVVFDGHDLTELFIVTDVSRSWLSLSANVTDNPSGGAFLMGLRRKAPEVSMTLYAFGSTSERREAAHVLASWLDVDGPRELAFGDDGGLVYMAVPSGTDAPKSFADAESASVSFLIPEPVMLGETGRAQAYMPLSVTESHGPVSPVVMVGGTAPARMVITSEDASRDSSTGLWGVRLDDGDYARVEIPVSTPSSVTIDCTARTATVNGSPALLTLDSDWLEMSPGRHVISLDEGHGTADVSWRERWLT